MRWEVPLLFIFIKYEMDRNTFDKFFETALIAPMRFSV